MVDIYKAVVHPLRRWRLHRDSSRVTGPQTSANALTGLKRIYPTMPLFYLFELASFVTVYPFAGLKSQSRGRCSGGDRHHAGAG